MSESSGSNTRANTDAGSSKEPGDFRYAKIANIIIPIYHYNTQNTESDNYHVGREKEKAKLHSILDPDKNQPYKGVYLVSGFRGVGKTSLVLNALKKINQVKLWTKIKSWFAIKKKRKTSSILISLAHEKIKEYDILRIIVKSVKDQLLSSLRCQILLLFMRLPVIAAIFLLLAFHVRVGSLAFISNSLPKCVNDFFIQLIPNINTEKASPVFFGTEEEFIASKNAIALAAIAFALYLSCMLIFMVLFRVRYNSNKGQPLQGNYFERLMQVLFTPNRWFPYRWLATFNQYKRLNELCDRMTSQVQLENDSLSRLYKIKMNFFTRQIKSYPIEDPRSVEFVLKQSIDALHNHAGYRFVFVFDELDKINDLESDYDPAQPSTAKLHLEYDRIRMRQEHILHIISNLKLLFTSAYAKFVFIAGREMYDAALADTSDRDASMGSLFTDVIYIPSFLSDSYSERSSNITRLTNAYLAQFLHPEKENDRSKLTIKDVLGKIPINKSAGQAPKTEEERQAQSSNQTSARGNEKKEPCSGEKQTAETDNQMYLVPFTSPPKNDKTGKGNGTMGDAKDDARIQKKILATLSNFSIYLTYRSSGSPKKIRYLLEQFLYDCEQGNTGDCSNVEEKSRYKYNSKANYITYCFTGPRRAKKLNSNDKYLFFTENDQYRFALTAYLFTPFLITNSRHMKHFGDKLLVSSSYLLDHWYKFHGSGFSYETLELIPEIISPNKSPELRSFIDELIETLTRSHIRRISSGLYQYRFSKSIEMEINYVSKISEPESAAFNFTLDESILVKRHFEQKYRTLQANVGTGSVSFNKGVSLHDIASYIGDLHYHDQAYHDAIRFYDEALSYLPLDEKYKRPDVMFVYLRTKLRIAQVFEHIRDYDSALLIYELLCKDAIHFARKMTGHGELFIEKAMQHRTLVEYLRLLYQPLLCKLALIEKAGLNAIVASDILQVLEEFNAIFEYENNFLHENYLIPAEFYTKLANILYFRHDSSADLFYKQSCKVIYTCHNGAGKEMKNLLLKEYSVGEPYENDFIQKTTDFLKSLETSAQILGSNMQNLLACNYSALVNILLSKGTDGKQCFGVNFYCTLMDIYELIPTQKDEIEVIVEDINAFPEDKKDLLFMFLFVRLSSFFYKSANNPKMALTQLQKWLEILAELKIPFEPDLRAIDQPDLPEQIFADITRVIYQIENSAGRLDLFRMIDNENNMCELTKNHIDLSRDQSIPPMIAGWMEHLSSSFSHGMALYSLAKIKTSIQPTVDPYSPVNNHLVRLMQLKHKGRLNFQAFWKQVQAHTDIPGCLKKIPDVKKIVEHIKGEKSKDILTNENIVELCLDSIYCYTEIIRICKVYGPSFIVSYQYLASASHKLSEWCLIWEYIRGLSDKKKADELDEKLTSYIGINSFKYVDSDYHQERAMEYYYQARHVHQRRGAYKSFIQNMYFLDDDYNDDLSHFCAALERRKSEYFGEKIVDLKRRIKSESLIYKPKSYVT